MAKALITAEERTALPEILQGEYNPEPIDKEGEPIHGLFKLIVDPVHGLELEDVASLKTTVGAARTEADTLKAELGRSKALVETHSARVTELEKIDPEIESDRLAEQKAESTVRQMKEQHQAVLVTEQEKSNKLQAGLERALIRSEAIAAIAELKGAPDLLLSTIMAQCRLKETPLDGGETEYSAVVLDEARNTRIGDANGKDMTIAQLVGEMKASDKYARAFDGTQESGGGKPSERGQPQTPQAPTGDKSKTEKVRAGLLAMREKRGGA